MLTLVQGLSSETNMSLRISNPLSELESHGNSLTLKSSKLPRILSNVFSDPSDDEVRYRYQESFNKQILDKTESEKEDTDKSVDREIVSNKIIKFSEGNTSEMTYQSQTSTNKSNQLQSNQKQNTTTNSQSSASMPKLDYQTAIHQSMGEMEENNLVSDAMKENEFEESKNALKQVVGQPQSLPIYEIEKSPMTKRFLRSSMGQDGSPKLEGAQPKRMSISFHPSSNQSSHLNTLAPQPSSRNTICRSPTMNNPNRMAKLSQLSGESYKVISRVNSVRRVSRPSRMHLSKFAENQNKKLRISNESKNPIEARRERRGTRWRLQEEAAASSFENSFKQQR